MTVHDMRRTYWGHNVYINGREDDGRLKVTLIVTPGLRSGDEVLLESQSGGVLHYEVASEIRWAADPGDMYHTSLTFKERTDS